MKEKIHKDVHIGRVHLTVGDLDRSMAFYMVEMVTEPLDVEDLLRAI